MSRTAAVMTIVAILIAAGVYAAYRGVKKLTAPGPPAPGCLAAGFPLSFDQAGIAATIAAVADHERLPVRAVTVAYATALQESDLQNLAYGDRDSVGVFQQRPSQGWGSTAQIENPVYATTRFFGALVRIPGYTRIPVEQAAQQVQHSADGSAYGQFAYMGGQLAADFTGHRPRQVTCWYIPRKGQTADLTRTSQALHATFGPDLRTTASRHTLQVRPRRGDAWALTSWLVAHAQQYQLSEVRYAGYEWKAAGGSMGWHSASTGGHSSQRADPQTAGSSIVAG
jgi:hypothetical protein